MKVDPDPVDDLPSLGSGEPGRVDKAKESPFEFGVGEAEDPAIEEQAQCRDTPVSGHVHDCSPQALGVNQIEPVRLVHSHLEFCGIDGRREIRQSSGRACHRDPLPRPPVRRTQHAPPVDAEPRRAVLVVKRKRQFDRCSLPANEPPKLSRAPMAEECLRSTSKYGGGPTGQLIYLRARNCENPAMNREKDSATCSMRDGARGQSDPEQLAPRDDAVLPPGPGPNGLVGGPPGPLVPLRSRCSEQSRAQASVRPPSPAGFRWVMPEVGVEPTRPEGHGILSAARLPFRHSGAAATIEGAADPQRDIRRTAIIRRRWTPRDVSR